MEIHRNLSTLFVPITLLYFFFTKIKTIKSFKHIKFNARQMFKMITGNEDKFMYIEYNIIIYIHISVEGQ